MFDHNSKISCHVHENNHEMNFGNVRVVGHEANYHERLFLEAWFSVQDPQSTNLWLAHKSRATFSRNFTRFPQRALDGLLFESRVLTFFIIWRRVFYWELNHS